MLKKTIKSITNTLNKLIIGAQVQGNPPSIASQAAMVGESSMQQTCRQYETETTNFVDRGQF